MIEEKQIEERKIIISYHNTSGRGESAVLRSNRQVRLKGRESERGWVAFWCSCAHVVGRFMIVLEHRNAYSLDAGKCKSPLVTYLDK